MPQTFPRPGLISCANAGAHALQPLQGLYTIPPLLPWISAYAAGVSEFPVLVEWLCAQNGFVHTSLVLVSGWWPSSCVCGGTRGRGLTIDHIHESNFIRTTQDLWRQHVTSG
jgi:hypothetical protein